MESRLDSLGERVAGIEGKLEMILGAIQKLGEKK